ncbi:MAG: PDC sensor domain-containing protein, partial [Spirochaetia bacterium]|nr:PDC sensor domain-containing protein [Spirochaetia bacterium]
MKKNLSQDKQTEVEQRDFVQQEDTFVRKQSIQQEITSGVASIMGLVATIAAIIVFIIGRYYIIHDASERYEDIANSGALLVQQSLSERAVFLQQLSENATLQKSFSSNNPKLMDDPIKKYMEEFPDIEGIWFLNPEGKVFAYNSSRAENNINWGNLVHKNFLGDEWFYKCKVSKDVSFFPEKMGINTEDTSLPKNIFFWTQPVSGGCIVLFENTIL